MSVVRQKRKKPVRQLSANCRLMHRSNGRVLVAELLRDSVSYLSTMPPSNKKVERADLAQAP